MSDHGKILPALAREAIAARLGIGVDMVEKNTDESWLQEVAATFVTLTMHGQLRGCIGSLEAHRPLIEDVQANAVAAAFHDPRFPPLGEDEFHDVDIEVSVLSALQPLHAPDEDAALSKIRRGIDGVVLKYGTHQATFLPQVWEQLPDPLQFMAHLKQKAGLPADFRDPALQLYTYQISKYREQEHSRQ